MQLQFLDWAFIGGFFATALAIGAIVSRRAGKSSAEFFLSGRSMPWWLLGSSMVATTFSSDTPLLVTDIVRSRGVAGNWEWWAFLLTGMLTVFIYAKLWRRSRITTDLEFYELRYSGKPAAFLRGFRAIYLGVVFNVVVMATVTLAAIKISAVMFGFDPLVTVVVASAVTVCFSAMGGLSGVLLTDFLLFIVAMIGSIGAAVVALNHPDVGSMAELISHSAVREKSGMFPNFDLSTPASRDLLISIFIMPLAVQWWSAWYPGAEPGGGGYIAQRMLAAKDERHATGATLLFNAAHYALRPWPWIIVALASLVVFPDLESLGKAFPQLPPAQVKHDLAYPAMLTFLPQGMLGLVVASLAAAYMSTISTHLNWGSSYVVNDFWKRFLRPAASERELVRVGRISTVTFMVLAGALATVLENAKQGFDILIQIGMGTGLLFILRWFWWRINPYSEITAMAVSFAVALWMAFAAPEDMPTWAVRLAGLGVTTAAWVLVTFVTPPDRPATLREFYRQIQPGGPGWKPVLDQAAADGEPLPAADEGQAIRAGFVCMFAGCAAVYSALFATGYWLYGRTVLAVTFTVIALATASVLVAQWGRLDLAGDDTSAAAER